MSRKNIKHIWNQEAFKKRLKYLSKPSQSVLAKKAGIGSATLNTYIKKNIVPTIDKALAISKAAGVSLDWLIAGADHSIRSDTMSENIPLLDKALRVLTSNDAALKERLEKEILYCDNKLGDSKPMESIKPEESPESLIGIGDELIMEARSGGNDF